MSSFSIYSLSGKFQESKDAMTEALRNCQCLTEDLLKLDETLKIARLPK